MDGNTWQYYTSVGSVQVRQKCPDHRKHSMTVATNRLLNTIQAVKLQITTGKEHHYICVKQRTRISVLLTRMYCTKPDTGLQLSED